MDSGTAAALLTKPPKLKAMNSAWMRRSGDSANIECLTISNLHRQIFAWFRSS